MSKRAARQSVLEQLQLDPALSEVAEQMGNAVRREGLPFDPHFWFSAKWLCKCVAAHGPIIDVFKEWDDDIWWVSRAAIYRDSVEYSPDGAAVWMKDVTDIRRSGYELRVSAPYATLSFVFGRDIVERPSNNYGTSVSRTDQAAMDSLSRVERLLRDLALR